MAGLYAQGLTWEQMHRTVRSYATQMGSVRHLFSDLTLPIISVFNGHGFDKVIRESFADGAQNIEDLWLRCVVADGQFSMFSRAVAVRDMHYLLLEVMHVATILQQTM